MMKPTEKDMEKARYLTDYIKDNKTMVDKVAQFFADQRELYAKIADPTDCSYPDTTSPQRAATLEREYVAKAIRDSGQ